MNQSGIIELRKEGQAKKVKQNAIKKKEEKKMSRRAQSIYEYFSEYTKEEIDAAIEKLTREEMSLLTLRYGEDLNNPIFGKLTKEDRNKFYSSLIPKIKRLLSNPNKKINKRTNILVQPIKPIETLTKPIDNLQISCNDSFSKEESIKILEMFRTPTFSQMLELVSPREAIIISLKLGYVDGKFFSTESIANFLGIDEIEVIEATKKVLLLYKTNINQFIDNLIKVSTGQVRTLSLKPNKID